MHARSVFGFVPQAELEHAFFLSFFHSQQLRDRVIGDLAVGELVAAETD